ncbi:MAG TPA: DUF4010 domain-containing protein [Candidatus Aenigmarchaeota archaeon]|nr:DUF4010 domain-containing protein [Candidatus Aenigmarchaeota archaeon]
MDAFAILLAMALGAFLGMEREFRREVQKKKLLLGIRTSILICSLGALVVQMRPFLGDIPIYLGFLGVLLALSSSYFLRFKESGARGITTFTAGILLFFIGLLSGIGEYVMATIMTVLITFILATREEMHVFVKHLNAEEVKSAIKFAIIAFVVFPLLPDQTYFGFFNPYRFWVIVVSISVVQFLAFVLGRILKERGALAVAFFGGFVNSEVTTYVLSTNLRRKDASPVLMAIASMFLSLVVIAAITFPSLDFILELTKYFLSPSLLLAFISLYKFRSTDVKGDLESPFSIKSVAKFSLAFFLLSALSSYFTQYFLAFSLLGGLLASSPVVASISLLLSLGDISLREGVEGVVLSAMASVLNKNFWVGFSKDKRMRRETLIYTLLTSFLLGIELLVF